MAGSDSPELASAVTNAGGLGSLGCAAMPPETLLAVLQSTLQATDLPLNINFFCHKPPVPDQAGYRNWIARLAPYYQELGLPVPADPPRTGISPFDAARCDMLLDFAPPIVSFHFGLPEQILVNRLKQVGVRILSSATTVEEAKWLEARGCDAVIAQGSEAGGHRGMFLSSDINGQTGTMVLVPQVVDAVNIPVIAAGGIGNARGIAAALALGASGVQMGTAFLHCDESGISDVYRNSLTIGGKTVLTNVHSGRPTRVRPNRLTADLGPFAPDAPSFPFGLSASGPLRAAGEEAGHGDFGPHYFGQAVDLGKPGSATDLMRELVDDAQP